MFSGEELSYITNFSSIKLWISVGDANEGKEDREGPISGA
jgi:hypothetical protein